MSFRVGAMVVAVGGLAACMHVAEVPGPDGERAHMITCPSSEDCYEKAAELCPGGYLLRSSVSKSREHGSASSDEIVVSCKADLPAAASAQEAPEVSPSRKVCEAAHRIEAEFAAYWAGRTPGAKRLDELPNVHDFVEVCEAMPERVQRCMHEHWRQSHAQACDAVLSRLDERQESQIDALFLVAEPATH